MQRRLLARGHELALEGPTPSGCATNGTYLGLEPGTIRDGGRNGFTFFLFPFAGEGFTRLNSAGLWRPIPPPGPRRETIARRDVEDSPAIA